MRRQNASAVITSLSFLFLLFFLVDSQTTTSLSHTCSSSCGGELRNISYPFRLKGDPNNCGDPDYELECEDEKVVLVIDSTKYYVQEILYPEQRIRVVDVNFVNASCNLPKHSLSLDKIERDNRFYNGSFSWASFIGCSKVIKDPKYTIFPCADKMMYEHVYVVYNDINSGIISDLKESCTFLAMVPALRRRYVANPGSFTAIWKVLQMGFELEWSIACHNCRSSGGTCGLMSQVDRCSKLQSSPFIIKTIAFAVLQLLLWLLGALLWLGRFLFAPICIYVFLIYKLRRSFVTVDPIEKFLRNQQALTTTRYSYTDILGMTNHFNEKLGQGGFGSVFKGKLPIDRLIAVKMLNSSKFKGEDFISEVSTIGRIHHVNVVRLMGFCSEGSHSALVYEYMPNGSLDKYIFSKEGRSHPFTWEKLNEIALGVARGIDYLHQGCDMRILHFDIKPHNILLDHNFTPKISDFGLAKFYPKDHDSVSFRNARGTIGYIAPELISRNFGVISYKSDVYSFGMLLLEMAGGRKNVDARAEKSSQIYFPTWVYDHLNQGQELEFENMTEADKEIAKKLCIVGLWCIQTNPTDRPSMSKVVEMLEGNCDALQMPPEPFISSPPQSNHCSTNHCSTSNPTELSTISESDSLIEVICLDH